MKKSMGPTEITVERRGAANPSWVQTSASKVLPGHPLQSCDIEWGGKVSRKPNEGAFLFNFILRKNKDKSTYETLRCLQEQASRKEEKTSSVSSELKVPFSGPRAVNIVIGELQKRVKLVTAVCNQIFAVDCS